MNAYHSAGIPSKKQGFLPGCARSVFHLLSRFWTNGLVLLLLVVIGLRAGWSTPRQWSDGLFFAGAAQIFIAFVWMSGSSGDLHAASYLRYVKGADLGESLQMTVQDMFHKLPFGVWVFGGGLLTWLLAGILAFLMR